MAHPIPGVSPRAIAYHPFGVKYDIRNYFLWFGHLGGPIMECSAFLFMPAEAVTPHILPARKVVLLSHIPTKQGGIPTSEGCILTSEGVINAKQAILREFKGLFCAYQHVANTKFAPKCAFCPKNDLF
jgi:hypothetical protein